MLRGLYAALLKCRLLEEQIHRLAPSQAANYDFAVRHAAVAVGTTADLAAGDTIAASRGNLAAHIACGAPWHPPLTNSDQRGGFPEDSIHFASFSDDPFNVGTGVALAHKLEKKRHVVVALCCQEAPSLERWQEALKFAGAHKLPIVYVVTSGSAEEKAARGRPPHLKPVSFMVCVGGFPGIVVDGQDVIAIWRVAQESVHRARNGSGPTLIDCRTDLARDPLEYMEHYMKKRSAWDDDWRQQVEARISAELEALTSSGLLSIGHARRSCANRRHG